jgi:hypothetical protein
MSNFNQLLQTAKANEQKGFEAGARWAIKHILDNLQRYGDTSWNEGLWADDDGDWVKVEDLEQLLKP